MSHESSFISLKGRDLLPILNSCPKDQVVLTEKGVDYTAEQVARVVAKSPSTMFHIPRPR